MNTKEQWEEDFDKIFNVYHSPKLVVRNRVYEQNRTNI